MSEFKREERYVVIKLKDIDKNTRRQLGDFMQDMEIPSRDCVVVESDWPEYEPVWKLIEGRMTGKAALSQEAEPHMAECISAGVYESIYQCRCGKRFTVRTEDSGGQCPDSNKHLKEAEPVASVPQDVEEFIAAHDYDKEDMCSGCVPSSALREWMAGHARVKIDILETILEVVRGKLNEAYQNAMPVCCGKAGQECCGSPVAEWSAADMELMDSLAPIEKTIPAMLTARKDGMESAASQQEGV